MYTFVDTLLAEFKKLLKKRITNNRFWFKNKHCFIQELHQNLRLNNHLIPQQVYELLDMIANIPVDSKNHQTLPLINFLQKQKIETLKHSKNIVFKNTLPIQDEELLHFLSKVYFNFFSAYKVANDKIAGFANKTETLSSYLTQNFKSTSLQNHNNDKTTIFLDMLRRAIYINNKLVMVNENIECISILEKFTSDKVSQHGSKANKIYHFGGQYLVGEILQEFLARIEIADVHHELNCGITRSHINWKKENSQLYCEITTNIYSLAATDTNTNEFIFYHMGSDACTLVALEDVLLQEKILKAAEQNITSLVPITKIFVKLDLKYDIEFHSYFIDLTDFKLNINASNLHIKKASPTLCISK